MSGDRPFEVARPPARAYPRNTNPHGEHAQSSNAHIPAIRNPAAFLRRTCPGDRFPRLANTVRAGPNGPAFTGRDHPGIAVATLRASSPAIASSISNGTPEDKRLWTLRGMALSGSGSTAEALSSFKHALSLDPHYLPALEGAAQAAFRNRVARGQIISLEDSLRTS